VLGGYDGPAYRGREPVLTSGQELLDPAAACVEAPILLEWIDGWQDVAPTPDKLAAARSWFEATRDQDA